jgi:peptide chain release factor 1
MGERVLVFSARKKDFRIDTFTAGGKGGQHQNRSNTGVRITHIESGLSVESREHRSQLQNKKAAFRRLAAMLVDHYVRHSAAERITDAETIRTYHEPDNRVKDHTSGHTESYERVVGKPDLSGMIAARSRALTTGDDR